VVKFKQKKKLKKKGEGKGVFTGGGKKKPEKGEKLK